MRVGVDTGGTFTDVVGDDGRITKVPSTPADPATAVVRALEALEETDPEWLAHGTTVATNTVLERDGAPVALVTTAGFADVIEIARQTRPSLYDQTLDRPEPLVPRHLRFEVDGRLDASGQEITPLDVSPLDDIPTDITAVAVCLLHSDLSPLHERAVAAALDRRGFDVSCSADVSPEYREYERTVTTVANAYLRPMLRSYLRRLDRLAGEVLVMTSAGGLIPALDAAERPVTLLLSGPAGGVRAAAAESAAAGFANAVSFDMGGTSTDVCLIQGGVPEAIAERAVGGLPVRVPGIDIHTIGAGGGSIASIDAGGALVVGPRSAGAVPGPACYGRGGLEVTVTDADLVAGRIAADTAFPGIGRLDIAEAARALTEAGLDAEGVISVVDAAMVQAIRAVTVARGVDPRELALVAFGGAGPLHACALADELGMTAVVVPPRAGVLSAVGLLCAPRQADLVRSWATPASTAGLDTALAALADEARRVVGGADPTVEVGLDCRYAGQSHELTVASVDAFATEHLRRNGYSSPATAIEVVALRARATLPPALDTADLPRPPHRRPARGPCVLAEPDCTVWVPAGWSAEAAPSGSWVLTR